ncbi:fatty acid-binding protein, muscle-like isoform X1 [Schistocerca americana]|uniref:fatty acid-binding protein, muscle-like isoform X1 n=1 Tax=Schistocerca americana TaxID=7009 RepID=UPI001F4F6749|nr:fatty acid-binding protein, muscle-like isoform X1 [Schistocerca americana]
MSIFPGDLSLSSVFENFLRLFRVVIKALSYRMIVLELGTVRLKWCNICCVVCSIRRYHSLSGIGFLSRKIGNSVRPAMILTRAGNEYTMISATGIFTTSNTFRLGEEKWVKTEDGRRVIRTCTLEGNTLTWVERGHKLVTYVFEFTTEELKMTIMVDDVVCTRIFEALRGMEVGAYGATPHHIPQVDKK